MSDEIKDFLKKKKITNIDKWNNSTEILKLG